MNFAEQLQQIMDEDFLSIDELASQVGLSAQGLNKILNGQSKRTQRATIRKIAEGTNRSFEVIDNKIYFRKNKKNNKSDKEQLSQVKKDLVEFVKRLEDDKAHKILIVIKELSAL